MVAALYLGEFMGDGKELGAPGHVRPSWAENDEAELTKGATGWGARTLIR